MTIVGKGFDGTTDSEEAWCGAQYSSQKISQSTLKQWDHAGLNEKFYLPARNVFIPTNFQLQALSACSSTHPVIIRENAFTRLWYKQDDTFLLPKACITVNIYNPSVTFDTDCFDGNMYMFSSLLCDSLKQEESLLGAYQAGLSWEVMHNNEDKSITLQIRGFSDKLKIFLHRIMLKLSTFSVNEDRFKMRKEEYLRDLDNDSATRPADDAEFDIDELLSEEVYGKRDGVNSMTVESLTYFSQQFISVIYMDMLVCGNVTREQALELADITEGNLLNLMPTKPLERCERKLMRDVKLSAGCKYLFHRHHELYKSSATLVYYECSNGTRHNNMMLQLFSQIMSEPCYSVLRTQEQLGYYVDDGLRTHGLFIVIESDKYPQYVEGRVDEFMEKIGHYIEDMSDDEFQEHINSVCSLLTAGETSLESQHDRYWNEIQINEYYFDRNITATQHLRTLTKKDISEFYEQYISRKSSQHCKLSVYILGKDHPEVDTTKMDDVHDICHINELKQAQEYHPLPAPHMDLVSSP